MATLCITGMHRSGTSLLASWMQRCGVDIGAQLFGPSAGNPKGHFEDRDFAGLQSAAILEQFPQSQNWLVPVDRFLRFTPAQRLAAQSLVRKRNSLSQLWGWKDPRSVFFLRSWKAMIPDMKALLVWRPCIPVVNSLLTRSAVGEKPEYRISIQEAVRLWTYSNRRLLEYRRQFPGDVVLVPLDYVLRHDGEVIDALQRRLGVALHRRSIGELYDAELLHSAADERLPMPEKTTVKVQELEKSLAEASEHRASGS